MIDFTNLKDVSLAIAMVGFFYLAIVIWLFPLMTSCKAHKCKHNGRGCKRGIVALNNGGVCVHMEEGKS